MSRDGDNHFQAYQQQSTPTSNGDVTRMPEPSYDATRVNTLKFEPTIANQQQPPTSFPIAQIHRTHTEPVMEMPNPSYMSSVLTNAPSSSLVHHLTSPSGGFNSTLVAGSHAEYRKSFQVEELRNASHVQVVEQDYGKNVLVVGGDYPDDRPSAREQVRGLSEKGPPSHNSHGITRVPQCKMQGCKEGSLTGRGLCPRHLRRDSTALCAWCQRHPRHANASFCSEACERRSQRGG